MKINNLNIAFKDLVLYKDFSLDIKDSEITCILGKSGVGKTTLLNAISNSKNYINCIDNNLKTAYVYQSPRLIPTISVYDNLKFVMDKEDNTLITKTLDAFKILDCINKTPNVISGGQASRVAICRAIVYKPDMLLLDEPFKDLDIALKKDLLTLLKNYMHENKIGAIYVTHDIDEALYMADRILVFDGRPIDIKLDLKIDDIVDKKYGCEALDKYRHIVYNSLMNEGENV